MKKLALAVFGTFFVSCGGGGLSSSGSIAEADACNQAATTFCAKIYGCTDLTSALVQAYLKSKDNCQASVLTYCGATGFKCSAGAIYHGEQAQICKDQFNAQSCETVSMAISAAVTASASTTTSDALGSLTANVPGCMNICTGGTDGGGG